MAARKTYPFEESLHRLEGLVQKMESGDLTLEESLATFEEGIKLTRAAEQKVRLLIEKNDAPLEGPFDPDPASDD
jgi:exodeoxyribonuclease VII small subunit